MEQGISRDKDTGIIVITADKAITWFLPKYIYNRTKSRIESRVLYIDRRNASIPWNSTVGFRAPGRGIDKFPVGGQTMVGNRFGLSNLAERISG